MMISSKNVKFVNPPNHLKTKVGSGGIPEERIVNAQEAIHTFDSDFLPEARKFAKELMAATKQAIKNVENGQKVKKEEMIFPIMQLKANGGMFKYQLLSDVADICLQFMETVDEYNKEALEIIQAHENTINIIINSDLQGDGGKEGYTLVQELHKACNRYFKKYKA